MDRLYVNIADTPYKQSQGLMFVKEMPQNKGMMFVFSGSQKLKFWGENTFIPLDIAFLDAEGIIRKIAHISPLSKKTVSCDIPCKYALEVNYGYFDDNKIEIGDQVKIENSKDVGYVTFDRKKRSSSRTSGSAMARRILSQLMNEEYAYDLNKPTQQNTEDIDQEDSQKNVPVIRQEDLWQFLEDGMEEQPSDGIDPDENQQQQEEGFEDYPLEPEQKEELTQEYPQFGNVFDATDWAQQNGEVMRISYTTEHGTGIVRDVEPHGQFHADTTGRQILVTYDRAAGDIRAFILKNIGSFSFTGEQFEPKFKVV